MEITLHLPSGKLLASRASRIPLGQLHLTARNTLGLSVWIVDDSLSVIPAPGSSLVLSARPNSSLAAATLLLLATLAETGTGETLHYTGTLSTKTEEIADLFTGTISRTRYPALLDIDAVSSDGSRQTILAQQDLFLLRAIWNGDENIPTPSTTVAPVVMFLDDVPASKTDFFAFPGGVAPSTGLYQAADGHYNYTIKGGWTMWRRSPIASW
ncbi:MAG: hypothetical protein WCS65_17650 [Verrucomicrobiae bacterium]